MGIVGADLAILGQLVTKLGGPDKDALDNALARMNAAVQDSSEYWIADYADGFRANFATFTANVSRNLQQVLARAAQVTGQNLDAIAKATGETTGGAATAGDPAGPLGSGQGDAAGQAGDTAPARPAPGGDATLASATLTTATPGDTGTAGSGLNDSGSADPQVNAAIAYFNQHIGDFGSALGSAQGAQEILTDWKKLTPDQLDELLLTLTPQQLAELNKALVTSPLALGQPGMVQPGFEGGLLAGQFANLLATEVLVTTTQQVEPYLTNVQFEPEMYIPTNEKADLFWGLANGQLFGPPTPQHPDGIDPDSQVNQGTAGDCYFLSALAAVAGSDPGFIKSHIWANSNGTYTVQLFQGGQPVNVTVLPDLPNSGEGPVYDQIPADGALWVALYEKAYAQLSGGYSVINEGGDSKNALAAITGKASGSTYWNSAGELLLFMATFGQEGGPPSLTTIQALLASGQPVTAGTTYNDVWVDDSKNNPLEVVGDHSYRVESVYTDPATGQLMIKLINPWGPDGTTGSNPGLDTVTLTETDFQAYFNEVAW
jgi:hypothetical protein